VQVVQDGQVIADPAYANLPLFEGAQIIAGDEGRAEVQLEDGSLVRLSPNSTITFSVMQQQGSGTRTEVVVNHGLAYFELEPSNGDHSLRVNYGTTSFAATSFSVVRVIADQPPGEMAVFSGNVHLERGNAMQVDVHGGESLSLNASDGSGYEIRESIDQDSWDSWNADRDQLLNAQATQKTAAADSFVNGVGAADLDANGTWYPVPGEGYVWSPYDAQGQGAGWDPYGYGNWTYYPNAGYLWISGYPWGYAPYNCGAWNFYNTIGWGWAPGGGCSPWWNGGAGYGGYPGGGGWWYNIGRVPHGYQPPRRPSPGPIHPHPINPVTPVRHMGPPSIAVDRRQPGSGTVAVGGPRPSQPVNIGGHIVEPLRPVNPRPAYGQNPVGLSGNSGRGPVYGVPTGNTGHSGYVPQPSRPIQSPSAGYRPSGGGYTPPSRPVSGGGGSSGGGHASSSIGSSGGGGGGGAAPHGGGGAAPAPHK
jgi:hypothetical protein